MHCMYVLYPHMHCMHERTYKERQVSKGFNQSKYFMYDPSFIAKINSFSRVAAIGLQERIQELQREHHTWATFERALLNEYNLNDMSRMTRRAFMDWVESDKHKCFGSVKRVFRKI